MKLIETMAQYSGQYNNTSLTYYGMAMGVVLQVPAAHLTILHIFVRNLAIPEMKT